MCFRRLCAVGVVLACCCIDHSNAMRGIPSVSRFDDPNFQWENPEVFEPRKKKDDDDVPTLSLAPSVTSQPASAPVVSPPPTQFPTRSPTAQPTLSPTRRPSEGPSQKPSAVPSESSAPSFHPTTLEQKAACETAANSGVHVTDTYITVRFLYELLSPADFIVTEVAHHVDEKVQDFLLDRFVDCSSKLSTIGGVGPGEIDMIVENMCSNLISVNETEVCHLMEGTVVLYLTTGSSLSEEEGLDRVSEELSMAFNGLVESAKQSSWVSVQSLFLDPELGILGLHYIGGRVDSTEADSPSDSDGESTAGAVETTTSSSNKTVVPAIVVPVVLVVILWCIFAVLYVLRRRKARDQLRGLLLVGDSDDDVSELPPEERWKQMDETNIYSQVVTITTEEPDTSSSSSSSGEDPYVAAHEAVMADMSGMSLAESLEGLKVDNPVFVNTDLPTYWVAPRRRNHYADYAQREYCVDDTVDI